MTEPRAYRVEADVKRVATFYFTDDWVYSELPLFDGRPVGEEWVAYPAGFARGERLDFCYFGTGCPAVRDTLVPALRAEVGSDAEFLLTDSRPMYWLVNITRVVDCLDVQRSECRLVPGTNRIMLVDKVVFQRGFDGTDLTLFKIPQLCRTATFASVRFRKLFLEQGWDGLLFEPVW